MGSKESSSKYYYAHLEECRKRAREYQAKQKALRGPGRKRNAEQLKWHREYMREYLAAHPEHRDRQNKLRYIRDCKDRPKTRKRINDWRKNLKVKIIARLGNRCVCCGETTLEFLSVDHIHGGGNKHRKEFVGRREAFWRSISEDPNLFEKYRVLCLNCNMSRGFYGYCPHEREQPFIVEVAC